METVVVTGASRGMGLEFCRQYLARGARVFGGARSPQTAIKLEALKKENPKNLIIVPQDVSDEDSIRKSAEIVAAQTDHVDVLINNAGIGTHSRDDGKQERIGTFHFDDCWIAMRTMAVGPLLMAQQYMEMMKKSGHARIGNVSSGWGSISGNRNSSPYYYSAAKASMHQLMRSLTADVKKWNITVVLLDPGSVQTDMGGPNAPTRVDDSVRGMINIMDGLTLETSGSFIRFNGPTVPW